jgi:hypothetical protein
MEISMNIKVFDLTDASLLQQYLDEYNVHFFECLGLFDC